MMTAFVLFNVEREHIESVAKNLSQIKGVTGCFSVAGRYDLVAVVRVKDNNSLADTVATEMLQVDGILRSESLVAFREYSRHASKIMSPAEMEPETN